MEKLVKKAKKGDAEAFIALMEQNRQSMIRIAFAYLGNEEDVADAMQETILSAFEKLDTLRRAEYFRTWLIRILINQCIAMRRHRSRTVPMNEAEEASQFYDFSTDLEFNDLLKTLPEDSRLIFQMYYGEQFRFLYNGIIIKHQKTEPTYTKTSLFLCEKRRFFMARREKGVVPIIYFEKERGKSF